MQIPPEAAYLYDAVMIYAQVIHEFIQEGRDTRDGRAIIDRIRGRSYKSEFTLFIMFVLEHIREKYRKRQKETMEREIEIDRESNA